MLAAIRVFRKVQRLGSRLSSGADGLERASVWWVGGPRRLS
jgi:hypothetical protein